MSSVRSACLMHRNMSVKRLQIKRKPAATLTVYTVKINLSKDIYININNLQPVVDYRAGKNQTIQMI